MKVINQLIERSGNKCELCGNADDLLVHTVSPKSDETIDSAALICRNCDKQINKLEELDANHWRCLNDSMWNENDAVKVLAWRMLNRLKGEGWPNDLLEMMYLEDEVLRWAKESGDDLDESEKVIHKDSNGAILSQGDTVVLIKDLNVKGGGFTAKRGTAVRNISLVHDNAEHIEGKVNGQHIVILTQYTKKN